jgi:hypothetical protein
MNFANPIHNPIFRNYLRGMCYWVSRFELSRDIDHYENAERYAEVVKEYLPEGLQNLTINSLYLFIQLSQNYLQPVDLRYR